MIICSVVQQKGGSGKTTALYLLASGAISNGLKVHCIDGDRNSQLGEWERRIDEFDWPFEKPQWPDSLTISELPDNIDKLYDQLNDLEAEGIDLVLIDTRPGSSADTEEIAFAANVILVPTRAQSADYELAIETYNWIKAAGDTFADLEQRPTLALLLSDASKAIMAVLEPEVKEDRLTQSERYILNKLIQFPFLNTAIPSSRICSQLPIMGPLSAAIEVFERTPSTRIQAKPVKNILEVAKKLASEVVELGGKKTL